MSDTRRMNLPRTWRLRLMAVLFALLPFVLLELGLRTFAPLTRIEWDSAAQLSVDLSDAPPLFVLNESTQRWEIPDSRGNFFQPDGFAAKKPTNSKRIFVLGGSTVQGRPYSIETSFSTWTKLRLQAANPDSNFEVVNCGGVSYASYRVAKILDEVLQHQPDLIVVYTGHNEFLEDREYAEFRELESTRGGFARWASKLRTVTWLNSKLARPKRNVDLITQTMPAEVDARLDHLGGLDRYVRDPTWSTGVERQFALTLESMIQRTQNANVPLILCVPSCDLVNTPPFKSQLNPNFSQQQREAFVSAWDNAKIDQLELPARLGELETCLELDPDHAGANYVLGRLLYEQGDSAKAKNHLVASRDHDVCPLRATSPIVASVAELANRYSVPLVDMSQVFDQRDHRGNRIPDGIPDPHIFVDHVHPSVAGHQLIGQKIVDTIARLGWYQLDNDMERQYSDLVDQYLSELSEDYFIRGQQRLQGLRQWAAGRAEKRPPASSAP